MDKRIRRNEFCVIGLPRCDFVFSSSRTCFIGYGFSESALEMTILRTLLEKRGIEGIEAAGELAPGQSAFCAKICSKIIQSQFCIVLANNRTKDGIEAPSANVTMEYGLMLGFNKYVVPFQRESQKLPFNVAGLDTIKYSNETFARQAAEAIDVAIAATTQESAPTLSPDQIVESFLLSKRLLIVPITTEGDRNLFQLGQPLGFTMVMTFDGMRYMYFGNFTALRPETVLWRFHTLEDIIQERLGSVPQRVKMGIVQPEIMTMLDAFFGGLQTLLLVTSDDERDTIKAAIAQKETRWPVQVFSLTDISAALQNLG
ncbi:MAG TPA: hypothetical protein VHB45_10155 [Alloacidobacterium sp.]|nr:hypothetical protein [Alloacidobacterium sp.]